MISVVYADPSVYMAQTVPTTITFDVDLRNVASVGNGNDIPAAPGSSDNFKFMVQLSDVDMNSNMDTLSIMSVTPTITTGDLKQALIAQAAATTFTGTATLTITAGQCPNVQFLCIILEAVTGAPFTDADTSDSSNTICTDITSNIICSPGMITSSIISDY